MTLFKRKNVEYVLAGNSTQNLSLFKSSNLDYIKSHDIKEANSINIIQKFNKKFLAGTSNNNIYLVSISNDLQVISEKLVYSMNCLYDLSLDFSKRFSSIISGFFHNTLCIIKVNKKKSKKYIFKLHTNSSYCCAHSKGYSKMILSGSYDKSLAICNMFTFKKIYHKDEFATDYVSTILFVKKEKFAFIGSCDNNLSIFCLSTFQVLRNFNTKNSIYSLDYVDDVLYIGGNSKTFHILEK
jgi:outer membrane protein assembly factor BamB